MNRFPETKTDQSSEKKMDYDFYYCVVKNIGHNMTKIRNCHCFYICRDLNTLITLQVLFAKEIVTNAVEGKLTLRH